MWRPVSNKNGFIFPFALILTFTSLFILSMGVDITLTERKYQHELVEYYKMESAMVLAGKHVESMIQDHGDQPIEGSLLFSSINIRYTVEDVQDMKIIHVTAEGKEGRKWGMKFVYNVGTKEIVDWKDE
ncbi:competence type IV pilus minor pilin ComGG [Falsibacillus albus]|uniref:Competence protein ComG n=1 Tax=Falsibacillus albus TaxID=2478915 RepID=A0A3L7K5F2_9BACI|nr:competence type IV pilus minor pilin ComGG [Falsibacillus albus]RLQ98248.1 hypothetical protein D9X91_02365 [Falsibacillus albus]